MAGPERRRDGLRPRRPRHAVRRCATGSSGRRRRSRSCTRRSPCCSKLGPDARLHTTVLGVGHLGPGGVWHGSLYLKGGGDPTFGDGSSTASGSRATGRPPRSSPSQLRARGIRRVTGPLIGDLACSPGRPGGPATDFGPDIPDFGGELSALTFDHGSTSGSPDPRGVRRPPAGPDAALPAGARPVPLRRSGRTPAPRPQAGVGQLTADVRAAEADGRPLRRPVRRDAHDAARRALRRRRHDRRRRARDQAGRANSYDVHPKIVDGSGLSREDGSSPAEVVALLRAVWHTPIGRMLLRRLPVVGVSGTVQTIADKTPAQGRCFAKTGTLNGVTNLAGYCAARRRPAAWRSRCSSTDRPTGRR